MPVGQGLQLFTALQLQKVPSRLLLFPEEGHWILKPQNSVFWHQNFIGWLNRWVKEGNEAAMPPDRPSSPFTSRPKTQEPVEVIGQP